MGKAEKRRDLIQYGKFKMNKSEKSLKTFVFSIYQTSSIKFKFTLIELLVVVAIIGILAALLLPALQQAKQMAHQAACISNQKQMFIGFFNYANDWDGKGAAGYSCADSRYVPWQTFLAGTQGDKASASELVNGPVYVQPSDAYGCPGNLNFKNERSSFGTGGSGFGMYSGDAWGQENVIKKIFSQRISLTSNGKPAITVHFLRKLRQPEKMALLADCAKTGIYLKPEFPTSPSWEPHKGGFCEGQIHLSHPGNTADTTFFDGHVKPMTYLELNASDSKCRRFITTEGVTISL